MSHPFPVSMSRQWRANQTQRNVLFKRDPHCHWCRALTHRFTGHMDDRTATLDHIKSRPECSTYTEYTASSNKVLACDGCNRRRNDETVAARLASGVPVKSALPREGMPIRPKSFPYGETWDPVNRRLVGAT